MDITAFIALVVIALTLILIAAIWIYRIRRRRRLYAALKHEPPLYPTLPAGYPQPRPYPPMTLPPMQYPPAAGPSVQNPIQQNLFIPKGKLSAKPPVNRLPQFQVQQQVHDSSPTRGFSGRGSDKSLKRTCFLTGEPRSTCTCDACQAERKQGI